MTIESFLDSPDLVLITSGYALSYKDLVNALNPAFNSLLNQKVSLLRGLQKIWQ